jgi:hypothetical protein
MERVYKSLRLLYFAGLVSVLLRTSASAYLDPSTTAMITQIAAGALISLGIVVGIFRQKIILFFKNMKVKRIQRKIEKESKS